MQVNDRPNSTAGKKTGPGPGEKPPGYDDFSPGPVVFPILLFSPSICTAFSIVIRPHCSGSNRMQIEEACKDV